MGVTTQHPGTAMPCELANCLFRDRWVFGGFGPALYFGGTSIPRTSPLWSFSGAEHQLLYFAGELTVVGGRTS